VLFVLERLTQHLDRAVVPAPAVHDDQHLTRHFRRKLATTPAYARSGS